MGFREQLNENRSLVTASAIGVIVLAAGYSLLQLVREGRTPPDVEPQAFFSDDDGATYFADSMNRLPPFDHHGKQAVAAFVYRCNDGKPFVGYLQRYTSAGVAQLQAQHGGADVKPDEIEISAPLKGDAGWVKRDSKLAGKIVEVHCPDGNDKFIEQVDPITAK